jgi:hypothetical protein
MVVIKQYNSSQISELSNIPGKLVYDSTLNQLRFNNSSNFSVILEKDSNNNLTSINNLTTTGTVNANSLSINSVAVTASASELNYNDITTVGTAQASKALILDSNRDITNIRNLSATNVTGTLQTASQPNITSVGTLTGLTSSGAVSITNNTASTNSTTGALTVTGGAGIGGNVNIAGNLSATNVTGTLQTASQPNITSVGTLTGLTSSGAISITNNTASTNSTTGALTVTGGAGIGGNVNIGTNLTVNNDIISTTGDIVIDDGDSIILARNTATKDLNSRIYSDNTASMVLQSARGGGYIRMVTNNKSNATLSGNNFVLRNETDTPIDQIVVNGEFNRIGIMKSVPEYTLDVGGEINGTALRIGGTLITSTATELNYVDTTAGSAEASKALILDASRNISNINNLTTTGIVNANSLSINGTAVTASAIKLNYNDITTIGTAEASKSLILDSSRNISNINNLTTTGVVDANTLSINGSAISASAEELNYNDITTIGTGQASKTLVLDANRDITNIRNLTATNLTGTIQTAAQPNITSVGTLTGLTSSGAIYITNNTVSTNATTGALIITGGLGVSNNVNITGNLSATNLTGTLQTAAQTNITSVGTLTSLTSSGVVSITNNTASTSTTTGALIVTGGVGIGGIVNMNNRLTMTGNRNISTTNDYRNLNIIGGTYTNTFTAASGTDSTHQFSNFIGRQTINATNASVTTTNFSTLYIQGAPLASGTMSITNPYALYVDTGINYFGGDIKTIADVVLDDADSLIFARDITSKELNSRIFCDSVANLTIQSSRGGGNIKIITNNAVSTTESGKNLTITNNGIEQFTVNGEFNRIGIMNSTPSYTLDVGGDINGTALRIGGTLVTSTATELNYVDITTLGTAEASKALVLDANRDITNIRNLTATNLTGTLQTASQTNITSVGTLTSLTSSGAVNITNSTATTSATTGALRVTGGVGVGGDIFTNGILTSSRNGRGFFHTNGTLSLESNIFNSFGIHTAYLGTITNHTLILQTNDTSRLRISFGGDITVLTNTASTSTTTGAFMVTGGVGIEGALNVGGNINGTIGTASQTNITSVGTLTGLTSSGAVNITNNTASTSISTGALIITGGVGISNNINISGYSKSNQLLLGTSTDTASSRIMSALDSAMANGSSKYICFGKANSANNQAEIFYTHVSDGSNTNRLGIGFFGNNNLLNIVANGRVGIGTTSPSTALDVNGSIRNNVNGTGFIHNNGTISLESFVQGTSAAVFGTSTNHGLVLSTNGLGRIAITNSGSVGIGNFDPMYKLDVDGPIRANGTSSLTISSYAFYRSDGASGTGGGTTSNYAGIFNGRITCTGEVNVTSDYRMKNSIENLTDEYCKNFIDLTTPVKFNYNNDQSQAHFGYIAQDVLRAGFDDLVTLAPQPGLEEILEDDGFLNPADHTFVMSSNEIIPILAKNIKMLYTENEELKASIQNLHNMIIQQQEQINTLLNQ